MNAKGLLNEKVFFTSRPPPPPPGPKSPEGRRPNPPCAEGLAHPCAALCKAWHRADLDPTTLSIFGVSENVRGKVLGQAVWKAGGLGEHESLHEIYCKQLKILGKKIDGLKSSRKIIKPSQGFALSLE